MYKRFLFYFLFFIFLLPFSVNADELVSNGRSAILIEANTGKVIFEKDKDVRLSVASMTKMVAQIVILEEIEKGKIKWDDIVTASSNASGMGGSQIYLEVGEKISVHDLMKGISVASGNDATVAMAEYISGTEDKFVDRMNGVVKRLGLKNTHFVNCTGLDEDDHYSSSYDMAMIARELVINHPAILEFSSIKEDYLRKDSKNKFWLVNTNKLINSYSGADGLKTGHTDNALYCLATTAKRDNLRLIGIILGEADSKVRNKEMTELLDYGFNNIRVNVLKKKGSIILKKNILKGDMSFVKIGTSADLFSINDVNDNSKYFFKKKIYDIKLPVKVGDIVGKYSAYSNGKYVNSVNLIALNSVKKISFIQLFINDLYNMIIGVI